MKFFRVRAFKLAADGRTPVECTTAEWSEWFEGQPAECQVAFDDLGVLGAVSTIFLGIDLRTRWNGGVEDPGPDPLPFESLAIGGPLDGDAKCYATWADARRGHDELAAYLRKLGGGKE